MIQTVWPCFPVTLTLPYQAARPSYMTTDLLVPSQQAIPHFHNNVIERSSPEQTIKFFLHRSVFDLVAGDRYLELTDQKLLSWYLSVSPEDRTIIQDDGGLYRFLQRHPALEVSGQYVYVKNNIGGTWYCGGNNPSQTIKSKEPTSGTPEAKECREMPHIHLEPEMLSNESRKRPAAMASFCLDIELERQGKSELRSQISVAQGQSPNLTCAETSLLQSDALSTSKEESPECYSLDGIQMDATEYYDASIIQSGESERDNSLLAIKGSSSTRKILADPVEEIQAYKGHQNYMVYDCEDAVDNTQDSLRFEDQRDSFHSIMEEDKSILICLSRESEKTPASGVPSGPVTANSEAPVASSETLKAAQSLMKMGTAEKYTSPMPCVPTCDIMVGTELTKCVLAFTQTEDQTTADKHVITEVHMADLDYLTEEFIKLKTAHEKLKEQKERIKSCDCIQRAQQAELCLLALQYSMCRQHCWRLYCTSAEGGQLSPVHGDLNLYWPKDPPANIVTVLQKLETDYKQMREKILAGVPLEQLKPLSVDSEKIITGASYIPTQIIGDVLGNAPSWSSQQAQKRKTLSEGTGYSDGQNGNGCQDDQRKQNPANQLTKDSCKSKRAVTLVPQTRDDNAHKPEEKQTTGVCKELNVSEAWYDAEEDLEPAVAAETGEEAKDKRDGTESASEETKSSVLCVSNLPSNVTESDVMLCFEKYHASEVSISTLKNDLRFAIVMVSSHQSAEGAVTDLNGCIMQGHTLHVEHINRATAGSQGQASTSISWPESSQYTSKTDSSSTLRKLTPPLLGSGIKNRKVVCISPTAKGTCVPQHYGTMGSFDTLMAELTQRHPDIRRQRIVDALIELRTQHQGVLSGLPLSTIRKMTSELLTRPAGDTQL